MKEYMSRIISIIVIVVLLVIVPIVYELRMWESKKQITLDNITYNFVDRVCDRGYIDNKMYIEFLKDISTFTGDTFEIKLVHKKEIYYPAESADGYMAIDDSYSDREILSKIKSAGKYKLEVGDRFYAYLKRRNQSTYATLISYFLGASYNNLTSNYSGDVQNERY